MIEAEWRECAEPLRLLGAVRGTASGRQLRRLACAVCRRVPGQMEQVGLREAVAEAERYTDGEAGIEAMRVAWHKASLPLGEVLFYSRRGGGTGGRPPGPVSGGQIQKTAGAGVRAAGKLAGLSGSLGGACGACGGRER